MEKLISPEEFIRRAVGVPWVRWRSDWSGCDCFGLLVLYHREVLGVEIEVPALAKRWRESADMAIAFAASRAWLECEPEVNATCFMAYRDNAPLHCGVMLWPNQVLHAQGWPDRGGNVRVTSLSAMRHLHGEIRFYRYAPC